VELFRSANIDWLGKKWYFLGFSLIFSIAGVSSMLFWNGIPKGVDFKGGTAITIDFASAPHEDHIRAALDAAHILSAFEAACRGAYGRVLPGVPVRILNLRSAVTGLRPKLDLEALAPGPEASLERAHRGTRLVRFGLWQETALYDRLLLPVGATIEGPAILDQPDATIVVEPGSWARVDGVGNLLLGVEADAA